MTAREGTGARSRTREGRLRAELDYSGALGEEDSPVRHIEQPDGTALCGADTGDEMTAWGEDCPECAEREEAMAWV